MSRLLALLVLPFLLITAHPAAADILDASGVAQAIARGAVLWDVREPAAYRQGHLPGAVTVEGAADILRLPTPREFDALVKAEKTLSAAGIDLGKEVVVYAHRGSPVAYAALAAVRYFGGKHASVFHDGVEGWVEAGKPLEAGETTRAPVTLRIRPDTAMTVTTDELIARLKNPDVQIVDVRTPAEYAGLDVRAPRGGHVPGAVNIPYEQNWVDPDAAQKLARRQTADTRGMALKPEAELRALYANLDPTKETIVYCQSGTRASETFGILQELGFGKARLYKLSWAGWAGRPDAPVVTGSAPGR